MSPSSAPDLQHTALDAFQVIRNRLGLIFFCFVLVFALALAVTFVLPKKYRGIIEIRIERQDTKVDVFQGRNTLDSLVMSEQWFKTEIETITKAETLYPVVDSLNLQNHWQAPTRNSAMQRLKGGLEVQSALRSDMVKIQFFDEDRDMAASIVNRVADSYMERRTAVARDQKEAALKVVERQIAEKTTLANAARERKIAAMKLAGIVNDGSMRGGFSRTPGYEVATPEQQLEYVRLQELNRSKIEVQALEAQIFELEKLSPQDFARQATAMNVQNPVLASSMAELTTAEVRLQGMILGGLGNKHPNVLAIKGQIDLLVEAIGQQAVSHLAGLRNKLATARAAVEELEKYNDVSKKGALDQMGNHADYLNASREVEEYESVLTKLKERFDEEKSALEMVRAPATVHERAEPEGKPAKPNVILNLAMGAVLGLMLGVGLAFGLESLDTTVRSLDDVERLLGVPVLAVIPKDVGVLHRTSGFTPEAEAYRILRTNLEFNRKNPNANCLTVVSGGAGEGKSTTLTNLAFVCAQGGYTVLLIDADLRRPRLHTLFDVGNSVGLSNYLATQVPLEEVVVQTQVENLYFLPSGLLPADSAGVLNSVRMSELIEDVKARFDLVLIDSPPILGVSDASVLVNEADLTLIVVQHRKLPRQMLLRVKQAIENVGGTVLGVVLNNVDTRSDVQYQYYTSYYTYYAPNNAASPSSGGGKRRRSQAEKPVEAAAAQPHSLIAKVTDNRGRDDDDLF